MCKTTDGRTLYQGQDWPKRHPHQLEIFSRHASPLLCQCRSVVVILRGHWHQHSRDCCTHGYVNNQPPSSENSYSLQWRIPVQQAQICTYNPSFSSPYLFSHSETRHDHVINQSTSLHSGYGTIDRKLGHIVFNPNLLK